jgi:hypothetical protein
VELGQKPEEAERSDGAHHARRQRCFRQREEAARRLLGALGPLVDVVEMRAHERTELGQVHAFAVAVKQEAAQFPLEFLDRAGQCRLGDVRHFSRSREVERGCGREEIADLVHFHRFAPSECRACIGAMNSWHFRPSGKPRNLPPRPRHLARFPTEPRSWTC